MVHSNPARTSRANSLSHQKEDEFETMIEAFKHRLEEINKHGLSLMKLRPNLNTEWIEGLKGQLKFFSSH